MEKFKSNLVKDRTTPQNSGLESPNDFASMAEDTIRKSSATSLKEYVDKESKSSEPTSQSQSISPNVKAPETAG